MNWENINLKSEYERSRNFLESYDFNTLLLELECNFKTEDLTEEKILQHTEEVMRRNLAEAKTILKDNIKNIIQHEKQERKKRLNIK